MKLTSKTAGQVTYHDYDMPTTYLDSEEFRLYTVEVYEAITRPSTIGDIRRAMGERFNERRIQDALDALQGVGSIKKLWGVPSRYERQEIPKARKRTENITPARPTERITPDRSSFPERVR